MKVIDFCGFLEHEVCLNFVEKYVLDQEGYVQIFGPGLIKHLKVDSSLLYSIDRAPDKKEALHNVKQAVMNQIDTAESIRKLQQAGIVNTVLFCNNAKDVTEVSKLGDFVYPFMGIDHPDEAEKINQIESLVDQGKLKGVFVNPFISRIHAHDPKYYSLYETCQRKGIPIWIHASINRNVKSSNYLGHPMNLEKVAIDFPKLNIVAGHGGWPWLQDMIALAWKYNNIFIDISAHRPKYMAKAGSGWEPLLNYGDSVLRNKVLFGSEWYLMTISLEEYIQEVLQLPLSDKTKECWLYQNAANLLNIR